MWVKKGEIKRKKGHVANVIGAELKKGGEE
jgi:hypothetical protein